MNMVTCADIIYQTYKQALPKDVAAITLQAFEDLNQDGTVYELKYLVSELLEKGLQQNLTQQFQTKGESFADFQEFLNSFSEG